MASVEVGMKHAKLVAVLRDALQFFEGNTGKETSYTISDGGSHEIILGNEDMERDDVEADEVYIDITA